MYRKIRIFIDLIGFRYGIADVTSKYTRDYGEVLLRRQIIQQQHDNEVYRRENAVIS